MSYSIKNVITNNSNNEIFEKNDYVRIKLKESYLNRNKGCMTKIMEGRICYISDNTLQIDLSEKMKTCVHDISILAVIDIKKLVVEVLDD